jgi:hypothetical protein
MQNDTALVSHSPGDGAHEEQTSQVLRVAHRDDRDFSADWDSARALLPAAHDTDAVIAPVVDTFGWECTPLDIAVTVCD